LSYALGVSAIGLAITSQSRAASAFLSAAWRACALGGGRVVWLVANCATSLWCLSMARWAASICRSRSSIAARSSFSLAMTACSSPGGFETSISLALGSADRPNLSSSSACLANFDLAHVIINLCMPAEMGACLSKSRSPDEMLLVHSVMTLRPSTFSAPYSSLSLCVRTSLRCRGEVSCEVPLNKTHQTNCHDSQGTREREGLWGGASHQAYLELQHVAEESSLQERFLAANLFRLRGLPATISPCLAHHKDCQDGEWRQRRWEECRPQVSREADIVAKASATGCARPRICRCSRLQRRASAVGYNSASGIDSAKTISVLRTILARP